MQLESVAGRPGGRPLVSVGIPTYNRPEGLARTLLDIQNQTYAHLEIIIGDNASTDPAVQEVCRKAISCDHRIKILRHSKNLGAHANFIRVLEAASGDFFMWAADDDRHDSDFVELCLGQFLHDSSAALACVMTGFQIHYYRSGQSFPQSIPSLDPGDSPDSGLLKYLLLPTSSLVYGLFRRSALLSLAFSSFDWSDCFLLVNLLANGWRIKTLPEHFAYAAGIVTEYYELKPACPKAGRVFQYRPFLGHSLRAIWASAVLSLWGRLRATVAVLHFGVASFLKYERECQPFLCLLYRFTLLPVLSAANKSLNAGFQSCS